MPSFSSYQVQFLLNFCSVHFYSYVSHRSPLTPYPMRYSDYQMFLTENNYYSSTLYFPTRSSGCRHLGRFASPADPRTIHQIPSPARAPRDLCLQPLPGALFHPRNRPVPGGFAEKDAAPPGRAVGAGRSHGARYHRAAGRESTGPSAFVSATVACEAGLLGAGLCVEIVSPAAFGTFLHFFPVFLVSEVCLDAASACHHFLRHLFPLVKVWYSRLYVSKSISKITCFFCSWSWRTMWIISSTPTKDATQSTQVSNEHHYFCLLLTLVVC